MKKKGFTLVELLAVIAILAILVIIALPNVMNLFNRAKQNAFETEIKEVFKTAQQQWIADSMFNTQEKEYANCKSGCSNKLDMSGRSELEYYIKLDKSGNVVTYKVTDGTYQYSYTGTGLKIENISDVVQISKIDDENDIISITCNGATGGGNNTTTTYVYSSSRNSAYIGQQLPNNVTTYNTYQEAIDAWAELGDFNYIRNVFIRYTLSNNIVTEVSIGFKYNNSVNYLQGGDASYFNTNKSSLNQIFGASNCSGDSTYYSCSGGQTSVYLSNDGYVQVFADNAFCQVNEDNEIYCDFAYPSGS